KVWTGCLQAGSTPSAFRLTLDPGTAVAGPDDPASLGDPFVQLLGDAKKLDFAKHMGTHVRVSGKELSPAEAEREAALRPDQQEANATAAGLGGRGGGHLRYVRVEAISSTSGAERPLPLPGRGRDEFHFLRPPSSARPQKLKFIPTPDSPCTPSTGPSSS